MQGGLKDDVTPAPSLQTTAFEQRGQKYSFGAPVTAATQAGAYVAVAFGDGYVRFFAAGQDPIEIKAHAGVVLSMAAEGDGVLTGGDDGRFVKVSANGEIHEIANFGSKWVDCVAASHGQRACSSGRYLHIWSQGAPSAIVCPHPSTIGGLAFDAKGKRLAASYYGGASVWSREKRWKSKKLIWKGFHGALFFSPDGKYLVSSMQESAVHAWNLRGKGGFTMPGYPSKIDSLVWAGSTPYLVTSGADEAICWPFDGTDGPKGRKPLCIAFNQEQFVTALCPLAGEDAVFAGYRDGSVQLSELDAAKPSYLVSNATGSDVTALVVHGIDLLIGDAGGNVLWGALKEGDPFTRSFERNLNIAEGAFTAPSCSGARSARTTHPSPSIHSPFGQNA